MLLARLLEGLFLLVFVIVFIFVLLPWAGNGLSNVAQNTMQSPTPQLP